MAGIGVALPGRARDQQAIWDGYFRDHFGGSRAAERIFAAAGVRRRHAVADPLTEDVSRWSTQRRMRRYGQEAPPLGHRAVTTALARAGLAPAGVGLLVVASCTGYGTPGLDISLAASLRLPPDTQRLLVGHMGCYAAIPALRSAADFVVNRGRPAVLLCLELTSLHVQPPTDDPQQVVSHALFGDAAVALVLTPSSNTGPPPTSSPNSGNGSENTSGNGSPNAGRSSDENGCGDVSGNGGGNGGGDGSPNASGNGGANGCGIVSGDGGENRGVNGGGNGERPGWPPGGAPTAGAPARPPLRLLDIAAVTDTTASDAMTWEVTDHGFRMVLQPEVPAVLARHVGPAVRHLLSSHGLRVPDVRGWAVHPGGPAILDTVERELDLPPAALAASRSVLARYGNCSSPTVLLVLDELVGSGTLDDAGPVVALAFGPGLTLYAALLHAG